MEGKTAVGLGGGGTYLASISFIGSSILFRSIICGWLPFIELDNFTAFAGSGSALFAWSGCDRCNLRVNGLLIIFFVVSHDGLNGSLAFLGFLGRSGGGALASRIVRSLGDSGRFGRCRGAVLIRGGRSLVEGHATILSKFLDVFLECAYGTVGAELRICELLGWRDEVRGRGVYHGCDLIVIDFLFAEMLDNRK